MTTSRKWKIAVAGIFHETNTFAPGLTELDAFWSEWISGMDAFLGRYEGTKTSMGGVIEAAAALGAELVPGLYTAATPSGMVTSSAAEQLMDEFIGSIDADADGLVIIMHGAMVAEGYPDLEGECLRRLRVRFGTGFPIAMTLDLHGNISPDMAELANFIVGYDTYPHIDMFERAIDAVGLLVRLIEGDIVPTRAYVHTGMLITPQAMLTTAGLMKELMEVAFSMKLDPSVLNVTVAGGFPYSDVADAGMSFVVTTDGNPNLAERCASKLAQMAIGRRDEFRVDYMPPSEAIQAALAYEEGHVILAEGSDNVGGGAPADATHVLALLVGVPKRSLIVIRDADAVDTANLAGIGGEFSKAIGGKSGDRHGEPVIVQGTVRLLFDGVYRHRGSYMTGHQAFMGRTAVIECGKLTIVLTEKRVAPWDPGHILSVGLDPEQFHLIVVKSAIAWQTAFGTYARKVIHVDSPGCCSANLQHFEYEHLLKPIYPFDPEPCPRFFSY
ncbi:microcystinase C [Paenibacillus baekrokdamisoli]|uniref:Microcystinase C n=1 Tax=Paenibacillus baekrokdamisoli TaxID=1712516 RepID=A0A3G9IXE1_9BACL|nr:M81 family metallopeptidase [Paenibacillus baekrokdamisoli]MBB3068719.1 microcystin degradation protein MlrC [Paenibacillus baekrokdamisoli]BBH23550.1 microcystinase C [Paenibacillus baekrokdamisoli]